MSKRFDDAMNTINSVQTDVALIKQALLGNGVEGLCETVKKQGVKIDKHEGYFLRASGAAAIVGVIWAVFTVLIGRHK